MGTLWQSVLLCVGIEVTVVWVLRVRTGLLRRTRLERLLYVAALGTLLTQPVALMLIAEGTRRLGFAAASALVMGLVWAVETGLFHSLGRLGWRKAAVFSAMSNGASLCVVLALHALGRRWG